MCFSPVQSVPAGLQYKEKHPSQSKRNIKKVTRHWTQIALSWLVINISKMKIGLFLSTFLKAVCFIDWHVSNLSNPLISISLPSSGYSLSTFALQSNNTLETDVAPLWVCGLGWMVGGQRFFRTFRIRNHVHVLRIYGQHGGSLTEWLTIASEEHF